MNEFEQCRLCPRTCGVNRSAGAVGFCGVNAQLRISRAALHLWEEPCITGRGGSGAVFFNGCSLGCIYCQNKEISRGGGWAVSVEQLSGIFLQLQKEGAANINLVTAGHYVPAVAQALRQAKEWGLKLPVVYNSSGYELTQTLRMLEGLVDVYLPDLKYLDESLSGALSNARDYPAVAKAAIEEMVRQVGENGCVFDKDGILQRGVVVRHLLLPAHVREAKQVAAYLYTTYADRIYISLLNQFTPMPGLADTPLLPARPVTAREYYRLLDYALELGITNGFYQEFGTAKECYIPSFQGEGVKDLIKTKAEGSHEGDKETAGLPGGT